MLAWLTAHGYDVLQGLLGLVAASSVLLKLFSVSTKVLSKLGKFADLLRWLSLHVPTPKLEAAKARALKE